MLSCTAAAVGVASTAARHHIEAAAASITSSAEPFVTAAGPAAGTAGVDVPSGHGGASLHLSGGAPPAAAAAAAAAGGGGTGPDDYARALGGIEQSMQQLVAESAGLRTELRQAQDAAGLTAEPAAAAGASLGAAGDGTAAAVAMMSSAEFEDLSDGEQRQWRRRRLAAMAHGGGLGVAGRPLASYKPARPADRSTVGPPSQEDDLAALQTLPNNQPRPPPTSNSARTTPSQAAARQQLLLARRRQRGDGAPAPRHPARNWNASAAAGPV
eukprot:SAG22_NODE_2399_length_2617_cov_1.755759_2_plen_270_part_00